MFCVYTTLRALKLFCCVEAAQGHCLFLTCLYTTQGVMTSRIVGGCRHDPAHYVQFSLLFRFTVNSRRSTRRGLTLTGPCHCRHVQHHSKGCKYATASGNEEIGYYAKPFLSFCGTQTHNNFHIMSFFEKPVCPKVIK